MRNDLSIHPSSSCRLWAEREGRGTCKRGSGIVVVVVVVVIDVNVAGGVRKCLHGFSLVFRLPILLLNPWALPVVCCTLYVVCYLLHAVVASCCCCCMLPSSLLSSRNRCSQSHLAITLPIVRFVVIVVGTSVAPPGEPKCNSATRQPCNTPRKHLVKLIYNMMRPQM